MVYFLSARDSWGKRFNTLPAPIRVCIEYGFTVALAFVASYWIVWASGR